jgi:hypothetical protein
LFILYFLQRLGNNILAIKKDDPLHNIVVEIHGKYSRTLFDLARARKGRNLEPQHLLAAGKKFTTEKLASLGIKGPLPRLPSYFVTELTVRRGGVEVTVMLSIGEHKGQNSEKSQVASLLEETMQYIMATSGVSTYRELPLNLDLDALSVTEPGLILECKKAREKIKTFKGLYHHACAEKESKGKGKGKVKGKGKGKGKDEEKDENEDEDDDEVGEYEEKDGGEDEEKEKDDDDGGEYDDDDDDDDHSDHDSGSKGHGQVEKQSSGMR